MLDTSKQWVLFGYDMRHIGAHWRAAWVEFLWGDRSPVRARLDEVVRVRAGDDYRWFHVGEEVEARETPCEGILLPESLTLVRSVTLPRAAESDLDSAMALEVMSRSPFPGDDTASGWRVADVGEQQLRVDLCIVSLSATMRFLGQQFGQHEPRQREIWAEVDGKPVMLRGFGEGHRLSRYNARLRRVGIVAALALLLLLAALGAAAGSKYLELRQYQTLAASVQAEAQEAMELRTALAQASETVSAVNAISAEYPNPHRELVRLTRLLDDRAYLAQFTMRGHEIRVRGRATDAASVMQKLTEHESFAEVTAPGGIVSVGNTGQEQFTINIRLPDGPGEVQP